MSVTQLRPNSFSCDWGHCNALSVAYRSSPDNGKMLPVCARHTSGAEPALDDALFIKEVLDDHPIVFWATNDPDRNAAGCDGEDCDWEEPIEANYEHPDEAGNLHQAEMIAAALRVRHAGVVA
ncbi:hypothetical protein ACX80U_12170 [Arthrobacter sp. TmT3-37]